LPRAQIRNRYRRAGNCCAIRINDCSAYGSFVGLADDSNTSEEEHYSNQDDSHASVSFTQQQPY
jgi:hypothetical protein